MAIKCSRLFLLLLLLGTAFPQSTLKDPGSFDWSRGANGVTSRQWTKPEISRFLQRLTGEIISCEVSDFRFVDMHGNDRVELVAALDHSGRGFFNDVVIVSKDGETGEYRSQHLEAWDVRTLQGIIRDLKGDGNRELVIPVLLTPYLGTRPYARWYTVYAHDSSGYVEDGKGFVTFYKGELIPRLQTQITDLQNAQAPQIEIDAIQLELDKASRLVSGNSNTGIDLAISWSEDSNPLRRVFAISAFSDIGGQTLWKKLVGLAHDSDPLVRNAARAALAKQGH